MNLEITPQNRHIGAILATLMLLALFVVLLIQQIRATAAYTRAMNSIAEAARKGENMTVQVANFNSNQPAIDGNSKSSDTKS